MKYSYKTRRFIRTFLLGGILSFTLTGCFEVSDPVATPDVPDVPDVPAPANNAPTITSTAVLTATAGTAYSYKKDFP